METGDPVSLPVLNLRVNTGTKTAFIPAVLNLPVEDNFIGFWGNTGLEGRPKDGNGMAGPGIWMFQACPRKHPLSLHSPNDIFYNVITVTRCARRITGCYD